MLTPVCADIMCSCGAMTHDSRLCLERPRKLGAVHTNKNIAADEKVEEIELDFEGKRDRWNGYDPSTYARVIDTYQKRDELRQKVVREEKLKKKFAKAANGDGAAAVENGEKKDGSESESESDEEGQDEAKLDESKQMDFGKVEKRVRTTGGGATGSVRNLRIREDTAKYLINLDIESAYYDPKTRSMREDPNPEKPPEEKFFAGDNAWRGKGEAEQFKQLNVHAWEALEHGQDIHMQATPSQAEMLYKEFKVKKEKLKGATKEAVLAKYGNAAAADKPSDDLLLGQTEAFIEYDRTGKPLRADQIVVPRSRYEEDVLINNHTSVWGSWWKDGQWGFKCCHQTMRNSYCTGQAGIEASEATAALMQSNVERKEAEPEVVREREEKNTAAWGEDTPEDVQLDREKLKDALRKEQDRARDVERDERKRKYNVTYSSDVTAEEMEAYRLVKSRTDDPMAAFLGKDGDVEDDI